MNDLTLLISEALRSGWKIKRNRVLYLPKDDSNSWMCSFQEVRYKGKIVRVPDFLMRRMVQPGPEKPKRTKSKGMKIAAITIAE